MQDDFQRSCQPQGNVPDNWYAPREPQSKHGSPEYDILPEEQLNTQQNQPPYLTGTPHGSRGLAGYNAYNTPPQQKKRGSAATVITLVIFALVIVASIITIVLNFDSLKSSSVARPSIPIVTPAEASPPIEYFDEQTSADVNIPSAPTGTGVTLTVKPQPKDEVLSLQQVYKKCSASVVAITANIPGKFGGYSWGTGIVLDSDGYIITNAHVLEGTSSVTVTLEDDREFEGLLVGYDVASDIAVLKIDAEGLKAAEFGDSSQLEVGDDVVAIGNPLGNEFRGTMTNGIISAINRDISHAGYKMTLLQTNTAINEGNSGGPLINMHGQIIGITNMKMTSFYSSIEGIGFAIPTSTMKKVVDDLIDKGFVTGRPGIGISIIEVGSSLAREYNLPDDLPEGLYVESVTENSDAHKQGVRAGDVITAVNDTPVITSDDISFIKDELSVGDHLTLTIFRDGEVFDVEIELMDMSELF